MRIPTLLLSLVAATVLAACGGGGSDAGSAGSGSLTVSLTDAPSCGFDAVHVTVAKVRVHQAADAADEAGGWSEIVLDPPRRIDLLTLQNGVVEELGSASLPAGVYRRIRLVLAEGALPGGEHANSVLPSGAGAEVEMQTPSGQQSGLKINHVFEVAEGQPAGLVIDFDACRSVVKRGASGRYNLKPVLSVLPQATTTVSGALGAGGAGASVSVQTHASDPDSDPRVVRSTTADANGDFTLSPLAASPAGGYTLVVSGPGIATHVVTGVQVGADQTVVLPAFSAQPSAAQLVSGAVATTAPASPGEALVRALQTVAPATTVEVAFAVPDADDGTYQAALAVGAVRVAAFDPSSLTFVDAANAGLFTLRAELAGFEAQTLVVDLTAADVTGADFTFAP